MGSSVTKAFQKSASALIYFWDYLGCQIKFWESCPTEKDKTRCDPPVADDWKKTCQSVEITAGIAGGLILFAVVLMVMYFFFPFFTGAYDVLSLMFSLADYVYAGFGELFAMFAWVYSLLMSFFSKLEQQVGGLPILWVSLCVELFVMALLLVTTDMFSAWHWFQHTPLQTVFWYMNSPFRWIREWILQPIFGNWLGKVISLLVLGPFEVATLLISLPIGGIYWAIEKLVSQRDEEHQ